MNDPTPRRDTAQPANRNDVLSLTSGRSRLLIAGMVVLPLLAALCFLLSQLFGSLTTRVSIVSTSGTRHTVLARLETVPAIRLTTAVMSGGLALSVKTELR